VHRLQVLVAPSDVGAALYFHFKLHDMVATLHKQRRDVPRMLAALEDAADVWMKMHQYKSYGSGNGVMDPFVEVQRILLNIAAFSCDREVWPGQEQEQRLQAARRGLQAARTSLGFFQETWGEKLARRGVGTGSWVPAEEVGEQAARLYYAGNCALELGLEEQALHWYEDSLAALRLEGELRRDEAAVEGGGQSQGQERGERGEEDARKAALQAAVHEQVQLVAARRQAQTPPRPRDQSTTRKLYRRKRAR